jgi:hypothetical protein
MSGDVAELSEASIGRVYSAQTHKVSHLAERRLFVAV